MVVRTDPLILNHFPVLGGDGVLEMQLWEVSSRQVGIE
jgi:hypothetical protein